MLAGIQLPERCAARFEPVRVLASGGFGVAILAEQVSLKRLAVLKVLSRAAPDEADLKRFRLEAQITASLDHPGIVQVFDHDIEGGVPWIAYEYLQGETLTEALARGPLDAAAIVELGQQVGSALAAAHERGVAHRDVKPANLLRTAAGWTLIDFGIAKWSAGTSLNTASGLIIGTPEYIPPEYVRGEPFGPQGDVYALGAVLFQCAAGVPPYQAAGPLEVFRMHMEAPLPPLKQVPAALAAVIARALAKDPGQRPAGAAALAGQLAAVDLGDRAKARTRLAPVAAAPVSHAPARPAPPRTSSWAVPAAVLLLVAGMLAWALRPAAPPPAAVRFDVLRRAAIVSVPPAAHARAAVVRAAGRAASTTAVAAGATEVRFDDLDAATDYAVEVPDCPPVNLTTPPLLAVWRPQVFTGDASALIDFNFDGPAGPRVTVQRADGRGPVVAVDGARGAHWFHGEVRGLEERGDYVVTIRHPDAFGGVSVHPFRAGEHANRAALTLINDAVRSPANTTLTTLAVAGAAHERDPRLVPRLRALLQAVGRVSDTGLSRWIECAAQFRDRELAERLLPAPDATLAAGEFQESLKHLAWLHFARHGRAGLIPLDPLVKPPDPASQVNYLDSVTDALRWNPRPEAARAVARLMDQNLGSPYSVQGLRALDGGIAREAFRGWLTRPEAFAVARGALGLSLFDDSKSVDLLAPVARSATTTAYALSALAGMTHPSAREKVTEAIRVRPFGRDVLWAALRTGDRSVLPAVRTQLTRPDHPVARRIEDDLTGWISGGFENIGATTADSIVALALLAPEDATTAPLIAQHLDDPSLVVAGAAAWALARLRYRPAVRAILEKLEPRDPNGAALYALGQLGDPVALPRLEAVIASPGTDRLASLRQEIAIWSRSLLRGEPQPARRLAVFTFLPVVPTDLVLRPEQSLQVRISGMFSFKNAGGDVEYFAPTHTGGSYFPRVTLMRGPAWCDLRHVYRINGMIDHPSADGRHPIVLFSRPYLLPNPELHAPEKCGGAAIVDLVVDPRTVQ